MKHSNINVASSARLPYLATPLALLTLTAFAFAADRLGAPKVISPYYSVEDAYAVDLDGDGDLDVLGAFDVPLTENKVAWIENLGGGHFDPVKNDIGTGPGSATSVFAIDLDNDSDADVLVSLDHGYVVWYENTGAGSFGAQHVITSAVSFPLAVTASDLDGDGDNDVLSASLDDDTIAWYENLGGGAFGAQQVISTAAAGAWDVGTADLDGDLDLDVLSVSANDGKTAWYENLGGGAFGPQQVITTANAEGALDFFAIDLDGDLDVDVISASDGSPQIVWNENLGGGTFGVDRVISTSGSGFLVGAADLEGDGDVDILSAEFGDLRVHENRGAETFESPRTVASLETQIHAMQVVDLNLDGHMDVLLAAKSSSEILFPGLSWCQGDNLFAGQQRVAQGGFAEYARGLQAEDLDSDGDEDLLVAWDNDDRVAWYENLGGGVFGDERVISLGVFNPIAVKAEDIDGDGDPDVLSVSLGDDELAWYENLGLGAFGPQQQIAIVPDSYEVDLEELTGDGLVDILIASIGADIVYWCENKGGGHFNAPVSVGLGGGGTYSVCAADLNGDGRQDVLSSTLGSGVVSWVENLGGGLFGPAQVIAAGSWGNGSVRADDMDLDGDFDVVAALDNQLLLIENTGGGAFAPSQTVAPIDDLATEILTGDFDGDGTVDLVAVLGIEVIWYENIGGGAFYPWAVSSAGYHRAAAAANLDGDGDLDVATSWDGLAQSAVDWIQNRALDAAVSTPFCFGDGTAAPCPCGNPGSLQHGCRNSSGDGSHLSAFGVNRISVDSLVLVADHLPTGTPGIFFQGDGSASGTFLGDGLRCADGTTIRLEVAFEIGNGSAESSVLISSAGNVSPGDTRYYQFWYRDPSGPCSGQFNVSSGQAVSWLP